MKAKSGSTVEDVTSVYVSDGQNGSRRGRNLEVIGVSKSYGGPAVVHSISFTLHDGEFLSLLGPSGSGKSTLLLMVGGFERPTEGDIKVAGHSVVDEPPQRRDIGIVFQSYALFPHMSVVENVEFPLKMRRYSRTVRRARAIEMLAKVGLQGFESRRPRQLSGGQQQRVALARALVFEPKALLLDEPLGALDQRLREAMQVEIKAIQKRVNISVLYVTHDQQEAMVMSDRIAVLKDGRLIQIGTPEEVYNQPATPFVASFLGETNLVPCIAERFDSEYAFIRFTDGTKGVVRNLRRLEAQNAEGRFLASIRPERLQISTEKQVLENCATGTVTSRTFMGSDVRLTVTALGQELVLRHRAEEGWGPLVGQAVLLCWAKEDAQLLQPENPTSGDTKIIE